METRANYALIGAFTLAVIAGVFGFVYWFSGSEQNAARRTIQVVFTSSVSGLSRGASVLFNGLKVGEVSSIGLGEDPRVVNALIDVDARTPIKTDTRARLESTGFTGVASIALVGGSVEAAPLEQGKNGAPPTIYAEPSQIQNIIDTVQNLSGKVDGLITSVNNLVGNNAQTITDILNNVDKFSGALADNSDGFKNLLASLSELGRNLKPFTESLDRNAGSVDVIAKNAADLSIKLNKSADKLDEVLASAQGFLGQPGTKGAVGDIAEAARSIRKLADNLDARTRDITAGFNKITGQGMRSIDGLVSDGRRAVDEINRATKSIERNPQQFIFGAKPAVPEYQAQ